MICQYTFLYFPLNFYSCSLVWFIFTNLIILTSFLNNLPYYLSCLISSAGLFLCKIDNGIIIAKNIKHNHIPAIIIISATLISILFAIFANLIFIIQYSTVDNTTDIPILQTIEKLLILIIPFHFIPVI